ncbi:MAG: response regulator transcription factor [Aquisalimonadaceae bacterium]
MNVLLVDHGTMFCDGLASLLERLHPQVEIIKVSGCRDVVTVAAERSSDLILLDLEAPNTRGLEELRSLTRQCPDVPVAVISGTEDAEVALQAIRNGARGFIPKSHSAELLLGTLRFMLAHRVTYLPAELFLKHGLRSAANTPAHTTTLSELGLTRRQADVLYLVLQGKPNKAISRTLGIEESTVRYHLRLVLRTLKATTRTEAVVIANRMNLQFDRNGAI